MSDLFSKVGIDLGVVVLLLIVLIIVMMIMTVSMSLRLSRLNQKYRSFMKGKDAQSLEKLFHQRFKEIDKLTKKNLADLKKIQGMTLNKYGIVKYDAFDDVGGKMSFALAMLDKENTGFILNAIHSRDNCFLYLKEIVKGESYIMLSAEEIDALRQAITMNSIDLM
mgnify:CR=1 FL=1